MNQILFGLGNPGLRYKNTWHNLGFMLLDRLANQQATAFRSGRGSWLEARVTLAGHDLLLCKPTTYMNLSGQAVHDMCHYYKADPADCLVAFDDLDLPLGELRFRASGSGGNHNGMSHIVQILGSGIPRLRMGFRPPSNEIPSSRWKSFVLAPVPTSMQSHVEEMLERAVDGVTLWLDQGVTAAQNRHNRSSSRDTQEKGDTSPDQG